MRTSVRRGVRGFADAGGPLVLASAAADSATARTRDPGTRPGSRTPTDGFDPDQWHWPAIPLHASPGGAGLAVPDRGPGAIPLVMVLHART